MQMRESIADVCARSGGMLTGRNASGYAGELAHVSDILGASLDEIEGELNS
jgi:hypothetical protein